MNLQEILEGLSFHEKKLLLTLERTGRASPEELFEEGEFEKEAEVISAASWLSNKGLATMDETARKLFTLRAPDVVERGLPERRAMEFIAESGGEVNLSDLSQAVGGEVSIAIGWLRRKRLADIAKADGEKVISLTEEGRRLLDSRMEDELVLERLADGELDESEIDPGVLKQLRSRQELVDERLLVRRTVELTDLGREILALGIELRDEVAQLTPEMIQSGRWREVDFRRYDVHTFAPSVHPAKKHPLTRIGDEIRRIFMQMGFTEVDYEFVQPAFWNMDVLFTPQDHPARELQDTFYLDHPRTLELEDEELVDIVRQVHENGWTTGSTGWGGEWSREKAERALLRTHTTVNTIRHLSKHPDPPVKVFSLSRIFRKEAIDSTHLPEFTQIEGIIMEEGANFDMLVGVLKEFYRMMGFEEIRIRPGYFPYTEPSLEVEVFFNGRWMELGGAGVFRPEVTAPFGVKHPVLAWGLGFERLAMLKWDLKDIRELYISDVDLLRQNPIL